VPKPSADHAEHRLDFKLRIVETFFSTGFDRLKAPICRSNG
jgi:hypothetical protein